MGLTAFGRACLLSIAAIGGGGVVLVSGVWNLVRAYNTPQPAKLATTPVGCPVEEEKV